MQDYLLSNLSLYAMLLRCVGTPIAVDEAKDEFKKLMTLVRQRSLTYTDPLHMRWMSTEKLREPQFRHVEEKAKCTIYLLESSLKHLPANPSPTNPGAGVKLLVFSDSEANLSTAERMLASKLKEAIHVHTFQADDSQLLAEKVWTKRVPMPYLVSTLVRVRARRPKVGSRLLDFVR